MADSVTVAGPTRQRDGELRPGRAVPLRLVRSRRLRRVLAVIGAFALWQLLALRADSPLVPTVDTVVERLVEDIESGLIWRHAQVTLLRGGIGFVIAIAAGVLLGVLMARSRVVEAAIEPLLAATYPVPKLAL